jgi:hypothetical protein
MTLNKGAMHGIKPDMAVISSNGIAGIVRDVSEHYSTVMSVLNWNSKISSKIKKNEYFGSTIWDGESADIASLIDIPIHAPLAVGDSIVTSEFSTIFPEGIPWSSDWHTPCDKSGLSYISAFSIKVAMPIPEPKHMLILAKRPPVSAKWCIAVMVMRNPVAPGGCPKLIPPPYKLVRSRGMHNSRSACRLTTAKASLISK